MDDTELESQGIIDISQLDRDIPPQEQESAMIIYPSINLVNNSFAESVKQDYFQSNEKVNESVSYFPSNHIYKVYEKGTRRDL